MPPRHRTQLPPAPPAAPAAINHVRPHPLHGLDVGPEPPSLLNSYIEKPIVSIARVYGRAHAVKVVQAAMDDYVDTFAR